MSCRAITVKGHRRCSPGGGPMPKRQRRCMNTPCPVGGRAKARRSKDTSTCKGIVKSGPKKGKLKKGYKFHKGYLCPSKA